MKLRLILLLGITIYSTAVSAQRQVSWVYTVKPIGGQLYELHMTANIQVGWHIYAGIQPKEAIAVPTSITFTSNPLIAFGAKKEDGKIFHYTNEQAGIAQDQYSNKVDFVQVVKLKAAVKTRVQGVLVYQACTDEECLPPANETFSIELPPVAAKTLDH